MKLISLRSYLRMLGAILVTLATSLSVVAYPSGSPAGYTGSPGDTHHCVSCHGGSSATVTGWITSDIPASGYLAGTLYNITVTVSGSGKKGFELSPQNAAGDQLGVLAAGSNNHLVVGGTKYVTQNSAGSTSSTVIYSFTWTAPVSGTGSVTFYAACTVGKSNTKLTTLVTSENAVIPLSATASATPSVVCAGQSAQLNVIPTGGSGTYTYSWTSVPAGFTSTLPNPVVSPLETTQYIAHVSDGSLSTDAPVSVTVNQPATAAAGNDTSCAYITTQIPLNGIAANYSTVLWTTSGTGTFSAATSSAGTYFPSEADKTAGNVTLTFTASAQSPCTASAADMRVIHFDGPTGMKDEGLQGCSLVISPNPSSGQFSLKVSGTHGMDATVTISDIHGKTIIQKVMDGSGNQMQKYDLSGYPKGIYFVKVRTNIGTFARKLVID